MTSSAKSLWGRDRSRGMAVVETARSRCLARARSETINLVQWLARIANSYVLAGPPEERLYLEYRAATATFITKPFDKESDPRLAACRRLKCNFTEHKKAEPHIFDPEEHSPAEAEAWLLVELLHRGSRSRKVLEEAALRYSRPDDRRRRGPFAAIVSAGAEAIDRVVSECSGDS